MRHGVGSLAWWLQHEPMRPILMLLSAIQYLSYFKDFSFNPFKQIDRGGEVFAMRMWVRFIMWRSSKTVWFNYPTAGFKLTISDANNFRESMYVEKKNPTYSVALKHTVPFSLFHPVNILIWSCIFMYRLILLNYIYRRVTVTSSLSHFFDGCLQLCNWTTAHMLITGPQKYSFEQQITMDGNRCSPWCDSSFPSVVTLKTARYLIAEGLTNARCGQLPPSVTSSKPIPESDLSWMKDALIGSKDCRWEVDIRQREGLRQLLKCSVWKHVLLER